MGNRIMKIICLMVLFQCFNTLASIEIWHKEGSHGSNLINPEFEVRPNSDSPFDLTSIKVRYYFYDEAVAAADMGCDIYYYDPGDGGNYWDQGYVTASFFNVDPPVIGNVQKSNICCELSFSWGTVPAEGMASLEIAIYNTNDYSGHVFYEEYDWSFAQNDDFIYHNRMVIVDAESNDVLFGVLPVSDDEIRGVSLGGELVFRKDDDKVFVILSAEGELITTVPIAPNTTSQSPDGGELIFSSLNGTRLILSHEGMKIAHDIHPNLDMEDKELNDGLKFKNNTHPENYQVRAYSREYDGNFYIREQVISEETIGFQPNYLRINSYQEPGKTKPITNTAYSDGLGRTIQTQLKLDVTKSLISGTYYNKVNLPEIVTKSAPIFTINSSFFEMENRDLITEANLYFDKYFPDNMGYAYSQMMYYEDPLNRDRMQGFPGLVYSLVTAPASPYHPTMWYFSVVNDDDFITNQDELKDVALNNRENPELATCFLTVVKDPNNNVSQQIRDIDGNILKTWNHSGEEEIISHYEYDISGNLIKEISPMGEYNKNEYEYNHLGQLISKTTMDAGTETYTYDNAGRIKTITREDNSQIINTYDAFGRINSVTDNNGKILIKKIYDCIDDITVINQ